MGGEVALDPSSQGQKRHCCVLACPYSKPLREST